MNYYYDIEYLVVMESTQEKRSDMESTQGKRNDMESTQGKRNDMESSQEKHGKMESNDEKTSPPKNSNYQVINGHTGDVYQPVCLGTFMGAMEAYSRGLLLDEEQKNALISQGIIKS